MSDRRVRAIERSTADLRDRAITQERQAKAAEKFGALKTAARLRHSAKLDRMLADQQEAGLKSGAYLLGKSQHPSVEDQCGCREFCR